MKDYVMMICVNGKDHALSSGPRVALPGLLRDHLLLTGTKTSRNRQSMTNAETETRTQTFPFFGHHDKSETLPPPSEAPAQTTPVSQTTDAAPPATSDVSSTDPQNVHTPAPAPKKNTGLIHGVLGL